MAETDDVLEPLDRLSFEHRQTERVLVANCEVAIRVCTGARRSMRSSQRLPSAR